MDQARIGDRYTLLDRHATGGMATVWRARDEWTREIVAIKQLHPHVVADPVARARLEREAEALRTVAPTVSLYVNDFNVPARRAYERVGLCNVGTFSSVLF